MRKLRFSIRGLWFEYECTPEELPSIVEVLMEKFGACNGGNREQPSNQENDPPNQENDPPSFPTLHIYPVGSSTGFNAIPILLIRLDELSAWE